MWTTMDEKKKQQQKQCAESLLKINIHLEW